jgi:hypothetical protein
LQADVGQLLDAAQLESFRAQSHDGNRHVLEVFLAPPSGDDDLLEAAGVCAAGRLLCSDGLQ